MNLIEAFNALYRAASKEEQAEWDALNGKPKKSKRFSPPTYEEIAAYCIEKNYSIDIQYFLDFYSSKNWMIGKNKMKDWKATVRRATKWDINQRTIKEPENILRPPVQIFKGSQFYES